MMYKNTLELFNSIVLRGDQKETGINLDFISDGFICNFVPTKGQLAVMRKMAAPITGDAMFTVDERKNRTIDELVMKQILHYVEHYGFGFPGLFDLKLADESVIVVKKFSAVSFEQFSKIVESVLYANAPFDKVNQLVEIIKHYDIDFDINKMLNNEMKIGLFDPATMAFDNGDDVVRYMCYIATGSTLLIKDRKTVAAVAEFNRAEFSDDFFAKHELPLAQVFNRHKAIILAAKNVNNRNAINRIARLSKKVHVPVRKNIQSEFIAKALASNRFDYSVLDNISVRAKFNYLNLLQYMLSNPDNRIFNIRNGKVYYKENNQEFSADKISLVGGKVLDSLARDLKHLKGKNIVLDSKVDYGLPVSRKQTLGNLPFGTKITTADEQIVSGIYWKNSWGARDLDLSCVSETGHRVGWGSRSGYDRGGPIFSGDVVHAEKGAFEFITGNSRSYGMCVNIFSGDTGSEMELIVGGHGSKRWVESPIVREKVALKSREVLLGMSRNDTFIVYMARTGHNSVSTSSTAIYLAKMQSLWTIGSLFDLLNIDYVNVPERGVDYDYDLRYTNGITFDNLQELFLTT